jgi:uncharacterized membrane protein
MHLQKKDSIFPVTRMVAVIVAPFLLAAFYILYLHPETSGERFAWEIKPAMMAGFMGAGYLAGAYFFLNVVIGRTWHRVTTVFPAIIAFTTGMLLATIIHWERFDIRHPPFQAWLALYIITPFLVSGLWLYNRQTDPITPEAEDLIVPDMVRLGVRVIGAILTLIAIVSFLTPQLFIQIWPWDLTPLTARVVSGWIFLLGIGSLFLSPERRWSSWRIVAETLGIWEILILIAGFIHPQDLNPGWLNWLFVLIVLQLISVIVLYFNMAARRKTK